MAEGTIEATVRQEPRVEPAIAAGSPVERLEDSTPARPGRCSAPSLRLGVYAAQGERPDGADPEVLAAAGRYAAAFGLAFQVTDDLLDVESTADKAGKRVGKDAARGKLTYPGLLGVEESRRKAAELGQAGGGGRRATRRRLLADWPGIVVTGRRESDASDR